MEKFVSMKRSEKDKRKDMGEPAAIESIAPDYPWGLTINLDTDELEKLGIEKTLPNVGDKLTITAKVVVTTVSQSATTRTSGRNDDSKHVTYQITDIAMGVIEK
jgi:hypothetical protein